MVQVTDGPRVLLQTDAIRIVRRAFVNQQTGEVLTEDVIELPDGHDALGVARWKNLQRRDALGDWIAATNALVAIVIEERET